ncbi:uncharacterized protein LOC132038032 [Lycium ferocissimum]|uniref:uncharacterized protein LOC132038032 n=1 Tax=Lycium ferocissimum TaxID=112874 RepID=UPI002815C7C8|nr:uncharacterized protein LOC132038032 [Lycium ferocissimum]
MGACERLKSLKTQNQLPLVCIQEPKRKAKHLIKYMMKLGFQHATNNLNNKIWLFWDSSIRVQVIANSQQHIPCRITCINSCTTFYLTTVYAECTIPLRKPLWEELLSLSNKLKGPWGVIGDFNVIACPEEKHGGAPYNMQKSMDFLECLTDCGLIDAGYTGAQYTWCNNWGHPKTIWKRLDRLVYNEAWLDKFNGTSVSHLARTGSDHAPLLANVEKEKIMPIRYFKFLNIWCKHKDFQDTVKEVWMNPTQGTAIWQLYVKMKAVAKRLSCWSREAFGDIFKDVKEAEQQVEELEKKHIATPSDETRSNLNKARAEFIRLVKNQEEIFSQKAKARWLKDGDKNTAYFHKVIKDRRRKLNLQSAMDNEGHRIEGHQNIAIAAIKHFEDLFSYQEIKGSFKILDILPQMVTEKMNSMLTAKPTKQEVTNAIENMDPESAPGPDGFGAKFFQICIDCIITDVHNVVTEFFEGAEMPRNGFFRSNRGLRQGDPLSPALFVICTEMFSRMLNNLVVDENYTGFYRPNKAPHITYLAFADYVIYFTSGKPADLRKVLKILTVYENVSGQLINKQKSCVAFAPKASFEVTHRVTHLTEMNRKKWPIKYLGCPLFVGRMKIIYFSERVQSISKRILSWHAKYLSMGGRIVLINHVLMAMPIHLLAALKPPKGTFEQLEGALTRFLWSGNEAERKYHWSKWEAMCLPCEEEGVGFRCLRDVSNACTTPKQMVEIENTRISVEGLYVD